MTPEEFQRTHPRHAVPDQMRYGQWIINDLPIGMVKKLFDARFSHPEIDPFYNDHDIPAFWLWAFDNWVSV